MNGYFLFVERLSMLSVEERNKVIEKILNIKVLIFDLGINDKKIYIRVYDGVVYYHFCFLLGFNFEEDINISIKERIVVCRIYLDKLLEGYFNKKIFRKDFYSFLKIIVDGEINRFDSFL